MKTSLFILIILLSGAIAGAVHGTVNLAIVEPYLDKAINLENQQLFASGEEEDTPEFWVEYNQYRNWQKGGQILAGAILGMSIGALFGIIFTFSKKSLPGSNTLKKSLLLAGIMWTVFYIIPFLKYPANPPTVGETETVVLREILYVSFIGLSSVGALMFYKISKKFENKKKIVALLGYGIFITAVFIIMPSNPDPITAPESLVNGFRYASIAGVTIYWATLGLVFGIFWNFFKLDKFARKQVQ